MKKFAVNRKTANYLREKKGADYTRLDEILAFYASGGFYKLLSSRNFTEIEFFPRIGKGGNELQIYFRYYNLAAILEFEEENYAFCKYERGCSAEELESSTAEKGYGDDFDWEAFLRDFIKSVESDERLIKDDGAKKKKKLYGVIAAIALAIPIVVVGALVIYVLASGRKIYLGRRWGGVFAVVVVVIPLIISAVFDGKSKKM